MNNAYQETNPVPHVHWHLRTPYSAPVTFEGIEFTDKYFGQHYDREQRRFVAENIVSASTAAIKSEL